MISIATYGLFVHTHTQCELDQTSNISIHSIHYKDNINVCLQAILCTCTKQVGPNKQRQHPSHSLQGQYQCLLTHYFARHTEWDRSNKQHQHPHIHCLGGTNFYLQPICVCTQSEIGQTGNINIHRIHCMDNINIYLLPILCICTQSRLGQTSNVSIHNTHYKHDINIYLQAICAYTQSELDQTSDGSTHHIHCKYPGNIYLQSICTCTQNEVG
jgi:hypothetical protein